MNFHKTLVWSLIALFSFIWVVGSPSLAWIHGKYPLPSSPVRSVLTAPSSQGEKISLKISPEYLKQTLDQGDIANAVKTIESAWKEQYENYFEGKFTLKLLSLDEIRQALRRIDQQTYQKSALIYAVPTENHLELISVIADSQPVHKRVLAAKQEVLLQTIESLRVSVVSPATDSAEYLPPAQQLYQWVIAPLEPYLSAQKIDTLILCLGADLRSAPVAALHDGKQFLVEKYHLALIPAFNLLEVRRSNLTQSRVVAMGASQFKQLNPLPAVPLELSIITENLWQGRAFLNQDFTLDTLKKQRTAYPSEVVHLATHAQFLPGTVDQSFIQLWDQRLRLDQLKELGLKLPPVQLLVLSACQTAMGDPQAELGFAGLAVQSGAKSALASLWAVSDAGTLVLMTEFYRQLKTVPTTAAALQTAQVAMLKGKLKLRNVQELRSRGSTPLPPDLESFQDDDLSHPYYWSAFTLIGNAW